MPKMFGDRVRAHVLADASVINLNDLCPFFFLFGKRLVALCVLRSRALASTATRSLASSLTGGGGSPPTR